MHPILLIVGVCSSVLAASPCRFLWWFVIGGGPTVIIPTEADTLVLVASTGEVDVEVEVDPPTVDVGVETDPAIDVEVAPEVPEVDVVPADDGDASVEVDA